MAGGCAARVGAGQPAGEIGRIAGGKIILRPLRTRQAELPHIAAYRLNVRNARLGAQRAGGGVQFQRRAGAAVALVMPDQRHNAAAAAQVQRPVQGLGPGKPGQQQRIAAKGRAGGSVYRSAAVQNLHAHQRSPSRASSPLGLPACDR